MTTATNPTVHIIATGGSIAGVGPDRMDYIRYPEIGDHLTIDQNLARVPEIAENFNVIAEDMVSVGSTAIGPANWIALAERIHAIDREEPDTAGVVITHGTATLEEPPTSCTSPSRRSGPWSSPARCARPRPSAPTPT